MKLHLGCGNKFIEGFHHIDYHPYPHVNWCCDVSYLGQIPNESVELIYACHVLEHFGRDDIYRVLKEWFRVLKTDGILRVSVPDFAAIVEIFSERGMLSDVIGLVCGGQRNRSDYHKCIFTECSLGDHLRYAGFENVRRYDWRSTEHSHIDDYSQAYLPHMDKEHGRLMSLNIEATKPKNKNFFMEKAELEALKSNDPNTKVGCVIVKSNFIVSSGYNDFVDGIVRERPEKYSYVIHAEMNAIFNYLSDSVKDTLPLTAYTTHSPCVECAKTLFHHGIKVVYKEYVPRFSDDVPELYKKTWRKL